MKIIDFDTADIRGSSLILGFFDGIHYAHREVIKTAVDFANKNNNPSVLITFKESPLLYYNKPCQYIYTRDYNYKIIEALGVDYIAEADFSKICKLTGLEYIKLLNEKFSPSSISSGENHKFGYNQSGDTNMLAELQEEYSYKYFSVPVIKSDNIIVSSSSVKTLLEGGNIILANKFLQNDFVLSGKVIHGLKLGRELGFPTANFDYPKSIVKIPYGVYFAEVFGKKAIVNWGVKPTINGKNPIVEVHILDFNENIYNKYITVKLKAKIRDEKSFSGLEELKTQIKKDINKCLKL